MIKRLLAVCFAIMILMVNQNGRSSALLSEVRILGGAYGDIVDQDYDHSEYEVHHLISSEAWSKLGEEIYFKDGCNSYNSFIIDDSKQLWAPAILMKKEDHKLTRSYYDSKSDEVQLQLAMSHIAYEADILLKQGDIHTLIQSEFLDIRSKFGFKYDKAMIQALKFIFHNFKRYGNVLLIANPNFADSFVMYEFDISALGANI